ncbi:MAG: hypothetical protein A2X61_06675 [Ignavibacteria bacterium GWB2_35_12]|nr:MAG: hypothetical protein A2X63_02700 [Ignavibacteria bacterium GWA2_35_8]OGU38624.1 MAG: hypothetical protein A2X61_06675 [Ignavibacteria bacterium GWB2_35_12]OGU93970.1 MAG: hypothetical protein A2220_04420 [Ignavibacteria bacterium RIFOXYA2_FULL_35_10]OGV22827.1 MAG: hypothetical protein A2475_02260 [Ignavibacteria bacterium RIFOXYC2_FULL_35_21]
MKNLLLLIVILLFTICPNSLFSQTNWENYFAIPCDVPICIWMNQSDTVWDGPKEYNLCMDSLLNSDIGCPNSSHCCFKIIYYENTHHHSLVEGQTTADHFSVFISAILITNGSDCESCDKIKIVDLFYQKLVDCKFDSSCVLYDHDFLNLDSLTSGQYGWYDLWLFTKGACRNIQNYDSVCSDNCCRSIYQAHTNRDHQYDDFRKFQESVPLRDTCYTSAPLCTWYCDEFPFQEWLENCCDSIEVTAQKVDSICCVNISVYNPYCYAPSPRIVFQQYNTETGIYVKEDSLMCPYSDTVKYTMCPSNGNKFVMYKVLIDDSLHPGTPNCDPSYYVEGKTMYTNTIDLSSCCECDSALLDGWLTVDVVNDDTCTNGGCLVSVHLDIDSNITCYKYYVLKDNRGDTTPPLEVETEYLYCLDKGEFGTIKVYLLQDSLENLDSACVITKGVACDTIECCPPNHDEWLTVNVIKDPSCPDSGCSVFMEWTNRDSIPCYHNYSVESKKNGYLNGWINSSIDSNEISLLSYCIGTGIIDTIIVTLYKGYEDVDSTCTIMKIVSCDSLVIDSLPQPCAGDCLVEWTEDFQNIRFMHLCDSNSACWLGIHYIYRTCLDSLQEFQIINIFRGGNCSCLNDGEAIQKAIEGLITYNPMGFFPTRLDTGCSYQWQVTIHSCWRQAGDVCWLMSCPSTCCYQKYKVCRYPLDSITIEPIGETEYYGEVSCQPYPEPPNIPEPNTCYDMCNYIYFSYYSIVPMMPMIHEPINSVEDSTELINFTKNYFDGNLNLSVKSDCGNKIRVDISDVYGIKWLTVEQLSKSEKNNFKIDTHFLDKGLYVYKIYCNGKFIGNGKFIVE